MKRSDPTLGSAHAIALILGVLFYVALSDRTLLFIAWAIALTVPMRTTLFKARVLVPLWALMSIAAIIPWDISFTDLDGPPRFEKWTQGMTNPKHAQAVRQGKALRGSGSCVYNPFAPSWVWAW
ncbi:hypothetical protein EON81_30070 [bacterium]|nr:MAG: hypothetical protein EON81_30070 [bacterium]